MSSTAPPTVPATLISTTPMPQTPPKNNNKQRTPPSLDREMEHQHIELQTLHKENNILKTKLHNSEKNSRQLHERLKRLETRVLEKNVLIKGIPEMLWEPENTTLDKVLYEFSELMEGTQYSVRRSHAEKLSISHVKRIGCYKSLENRPILVCFNRKGDTDYVMKYKKHL